MTGRADYVVAVNHISRKKYPINWKIGIYRTDNNGGLGSKVNGGSHVLGILPSSQNSI